MNNGNQQQPQQNFQRPPPSGFPPSNYNQQQQQNHLAPGQPGYSQPPPSSQGYRPPSQGQPIMNRPPQMQQQLQPPMQNVNQLAGKMQGMSIRPGMPPSQQTQPQKPPPTQQPQNQYQGPPQHSQQPQQTYRPFAPAPAPFSPGNSGRAQPVGPQYPSPPTSARPPMPQQYSGTTPPIMQGQQPPNFRPLAPGQQPFFPVQNGPGYQPPQQVAPPGPGYQQPPFQQRPPMQSQTNQATPPFQQQQPPYPQQYQQAPKMRINDEHIPSPIDVHAMDQEEWDSKEYRTRSMTNPPLAISEYLTVDEGNASPRFLRLTTYGFPSTAELAQKLTFPLGLIVQPFAELKSSEADIAIVDCGPSGPVRCVRCLAYMNPNMIFTHGGQRFICNICEHSNECPADYFCTLDVRGYRLDRPHRPELSCGIVDYVATPEFTLRKPVPCNFIFLLDVSYYAVNSGALAIACTALKEMLEHFPCGNDSDNESSRIAIVTFDRTIHFYNLSSSLSSPQSLIVSDIEDVFVPLEAGFLVNPIESMNIITKLLDAIPKMFANARSAEVCFGAAVTAASKTLYSTGGRLVVVNSCLPNVGSGTLKQRDDPKVMNTDQERLLYAPQDNYYQKLATECTEHGIGIDLFVLASAYIDTASLGVLSSLTGGHMYFYPSFRAEVDGVKLSNDIQRLIIRPFGYDTLMRVRCGNGLRVAEHFGNFYMKNASDVEMAVIDSEKALGVVFKHDGILDEKKEISFQVALLFTSATGKRFIRCINMSIPVISLLKDIFKLADMDAVMNILTKHAITQTVGTPLKSVREMISNKCIQVLLQYRVHCAIETVPSQLILPEALKLYPCYTAAVLKTRAFVMSKVSPDVRVHEMRALRDMPIGTTMFYFYPKLMPIHNLKDGHCLFNPKINRFVLPPCVRSTTRNLAFDGAYLLDNALSIWLWLGKDVSPEFLNELIGVASLQQVDTRITKLPVLQTDTNKKIRALISYLQEDLHKGSYPFLKIVRQGIDDGGFGPLLVEDTSESGPGYVDFMCVVHKQISDRMEDLSKDY